MSNTQRAKDIERRIVQSYVWVLRAPRTTNGQKAVSLSRHGFYEVRLLEPSDLVHDNGLPFWVELVDTKRNLSIDSYGGDDIEETTGVVQHLISRAERLDRAT